MKTKKECMICGGGHHYYNCPNDNIQEDGSVNISNEDLNLLVNLVNDKISSIRNNNRYKLLHKKLLDILIQ